MDQADTTVTARDRALDFCRVVAVVLVVFGHWLAAALTYRNGTFGRENALLEMPWTQWLTWIFQVVPVFFVVAGYASAVSWSRWQSTANTRRDTWFRHRLSRIAGATGVYVAVVLITVAVLGRLGVDRSALAFGGWAVALHLWFLAVYLVVVALTPILVAAQRRWGLAVPAALGAGVVAVDALTIGLGVPHIGWLNYVLAWAAVYQLGIAWQGGLLRGRRPVALGVCAALLLILLVTLGPYPVSMIGVPGDAVQNTTPPSLALLAFAAAQAGLLLTAVPLLNRALRSPRWRRPLELANQNVMALYLWHMVPVVVVTIVGYPSGLLPQPPLGSGDWWLARLLWLSVLALVTAVELAFLWWRRAWFAPALPVVEVRLPGRLAEPLFFTGAGAIAIALSAFAARGFAPGGSFPVLTALLFAVGIALMALTPRHADRA
ncbi:MAG: acyltransferase family protein [Actinobacteria bacterium]|nr:acyltransferase family protein [Actinomycetota bacterium]